MAKQDNVSQFIRNQILNDPKVTLEQIGERWKKVGNGTKPNDGLVSVARSGLRKKYGIKDLAKLPLKTSGGVSVSALIRLLIRGNGKSMTDKDVMDALAKDGLQCSQGLVAQARFQKKAKKATDKAVARAKRSPDPNQNAGPRAKRVAKLGRPKIVQDTLSEQEDMLDDLMARAKAKGMDDMFEQLRLTRRELIRNSR